MKTSSIYYLVLAYFSISRQFTADNNNTRADSLTNILGLC